MSLVTDHDWYADLAAQNYAMLPGFGARQVEAGQEIFEILMPHIQKGALEVIVDLGCGSGEVLVDLARRLSERRLNVGEANSILLVGLDPSVDLIRKANEDLAKVKLATSVRCHFAVCDDPSSLPLTQFETLLKFEGKSFARASERMAVLCLGHTIFHLLYLDELFAALEADAPTRPLMFIVDVYHSWDSTIEELRTSDAGAVAEPRSFTENGNGEKVLNVLFTRWAEATERKVVERGLIQARDMDIRGEEVIVTRQLARTSVEMVAAFVGARYLFAQKTASHSGYGEVNRFTFLRSTRSFPLPALFLDTKAVPRLAIIGGSSPAVRASPLHILAQWMDESGFIEPHMAQHPEGGPSRDGGGFDFAIVEMAPWYNTDKGLSALDLELLICARAPRPQGGEGLGDSLAWKLVHCADVGVLSRALSAYRDTLFRAQSLDIGPFLHPSFAGYDDANDWARAHFSYLEGPSSELEFAPGEERERYERWRAALDGAAGQITPAEIHPDEPHTSPNLKALIERSSIKDLVSSLGEKMQSYDTRLVKDLKPDAVETATFRSADLDLVTRDLDMVQALLHERLRLALGLDVEANMLSSVLLGIPLRVLADEFPNTKQGLPDRHRGGVWVFAGRFGEFGPKQNALIGDLGRLSVLLANTAIDAKAADEMELSAVGKYKRLYEQKPIASAQSGWFRGRKLVKDKDFFSTDALLKRHTLTEWDEHLSKGGLADLALSAKEVANEIIMNCLGRNLDVDQRSSLVFLRGLYRGHGMLSVSMVNKVLNLGDHVRVDCGFDDACEGYLKCNTDSRSNAGLLLFAVHALLMSKPKLHTKSRRPTGRTTVVRVVRPPNRREKCELVFESRFVSEQQRDAALSALWQEIGERERPDGQQGNTACLLMRLATVTRNRDGVEEEDASSEKVDRLGLKLTFRFPYSA